MLRGFVEHGEQAANTSPSCRPGPKGQSVPVFQWILSNCVFKVKYVAQNKPALHKSVIILYITCVFKAHCGPCESGEYG